MKKVREISRGGGGDGVETKACSLIGNSGSDRQPVKMSEYWNDVNMWKSTDYKTGCTVLDSLKFSDQGLMETSQERVAIVNGERSFQYIGPVIWNSLSFSVRHATSLSSFKSKLKTHLFSSAY